MDTLDNWRKSSHSGPGDGNSCVEVANNSTRVGIRDSKDRTYATLTFPTGAFTPLIDALKADLHSAVTDFPNHPRLGPGARRIKPQTEGERQSCRK